MESPLSHHAVGLKAEPQHQRTKEQDDCFYFCSPPPQAGASSTALSPGSEHGDRAFPLQGAISEWRQQRDAPGPSPLGVLSVIVANANSLAISLAKPKTYILIFS